MKDNHAGTFASLYLFLWMALTVDKLCIHQRGNNQNMIIATPTCSSSLFLTRQTQVMEICIFCMGGVEDTNYFFFVLNVFMFCLVRVPLIRQLLPQSEN